jgi:hypothetical protein
MTDLKEREISIFHMRFEIGHRQQGSSLNAQ